MSEKFLTFRRFQNQSMASDFTSFLDENNIQYELEDASPVFDVTFANNKIDNEIHVKIRPGDFQKVEELLMQKGNQVTLDDIPKDYYLLEFSNEELIEILMKPDEWSSLDYNLSLKILKERGKEIDPEFLQTLRKNRNDELSKPEKSQKAWIYAGYIFALLGGLLGIFIGWHLLTFKKTLPNGSRIYGYVGADRRDGRNILVIGLTFLIIHFVIWWTNVAV